MLHDEVLTETEKLLLMAAAIHELGPETDLSYANAAHVVGQALIWAGLLKGKVRRAWEKDEYTPEIVRVYGTLIRMIHRGDAGIPPERPGTVLFEGGGNFGTPEEPRALPHFTSCRLTAHGMKIAAQLLELHPEYRKRAK